MRRQSRRLGQTGRVERDVGVTLKAAVQIPRGPSVTDRDEFERLQRPGT
jgi:hypothetical protein